MTVNLSILGGAGAQFLNDSGRPLSGGKLYSYDAGTTTPQVTYTNVSGATPHANPIVLDAAGRVPGGEVWLTYGQSYKFTLTTSDNVPIATWDDIFGNGDPTFAQYTPDADSLLAPGSLTVKSALDQITDDGSGSSVVGFIQSGAGAVARTVEDKLQDWVSVKDFGAVGDGVTDDTAAINAALGSGARNIYFPVGFYKHTGLTISSAQRLVGANNSEGVGSVLVCSAAGVDNITIPAAGNVVIENLCIRGNNPGGTPSTNGSGIVINTQATPTLRNVFIFNNGGYGIKIVGDASRLNVDTCRIQSNTLGGVWGKGVGTAQINAITIKNSSISFNGPFGVDVWGSSVTIENNIIESHVVGVKVSYVGTASVSAIYAYAIKNNYFEAHSTNQILVETTVSQTIVGFEITGNYGYRNTSDAAYRHVKFVSSSANEVRSMVYGFNAFYSNISLATAVVADFGSRLAGDCVIYPYFTYSTSGLVLSAPFTNYENLGSAKFEAYKSVICNGVTESFGGSGISYTTLEKSANITVSGSKIFFAPDIPLGALPVSLTLGIETDATSYSVAAYIYSRALGSTGSFGTVTASFTMPATSGSTTQTWIFNPLTAVRKTTTVFEYKLEITVTLTTPGTTFYIGNPSITYIG